MIQKWARLLGTFVTAKHPSDNVPGIVVRLSTTLGRIGAAIGIAALLFMQQAAASMLSCERAHLMAVGAATMDDPCPMMADASAPLCANKCDPDNHKGHAVDTPVIAPASPDFDFTALVAEDNESRRHAPPDFEHETGPPLYLAFLRILLP